MEGGLTQEQIALVLRRAAELDRETACEAGTGLDAATLELAAVEAGISRQSVRRALAELRAGVLEREDGKRRAWLGARTLTLCRTVPGPAPSLTQTLHRFLVRELFELRRDTGDRTSWIPQQGLASRARRALDRGIHRRLILREVQEVGLSVVEEPGSDGARVLVRLDIDVRASRRVHGWIAGSAAVAGGGVALLGAAAVGADPALLLTTGVGAGIAGMGQRIGSAIYRERVGNIESALGGVLDRLERPASWRMG
jgi:hypothetical protein